jgi:hypothetical protein
VRRGQTPRGTHTAVLERGFQLEKELLKPPTNSVVEVRTSAATRHDGGPVAGGARGTGRRAACASRSPRRPRAAPVRTGRPRLRRRFPPARVLAGPWASACHRVQERQTGAEVARGAEVERPHASSGARATSSTWTVTRSIGVPVMRARYVALAADRLAERGRVGAATRWISSSGRRRPSSRTARSADVHASPRLYRSCSKLVDARDVPTASHTELVSTRAKLAWGVGHAPRDRAMSIARRPPRDPSRGRWFAPLGSLYRSRGPGLDVPVRP